MSNTFLIYGKIIIDDIRLSTGEVVAGKLGGGGPQAAFGMRLWHDDVALLTRSGDDLDASVLRTLQDLGVDLSGWARYDDLPTPHGRIEYDEREYHDRGLITSASDWNRLLSRPLTLSARHRQAAGIHLITEFALEPMVDSARELQRHGGLCSLEPIFDDHSCPDRPALLALARQVEIVTPDWPSASALAGSERPVDVLRYWAALGTEAVAVRHGAHGSYVWDRRHGQAWHIPIVPVHAVDPTGAGNAYGGGWCIGWWRHHDSRLAGCYATVAAALMVSQAGMPPLDAESRRRAKALFEIAQQQATRIDL
ncbi:MAG TPA: carbohydrate kinase family protein [Roseiflexaceae bacterium]|nr:carbohydrate kinase family protein [Roseiflexaceae bacterium]